MNKWTLHQQTAIDVRDKDILVAAAAGSGKTAVLVERIIQRLMDPNDSIDILKFLVVTFTNAAAAEMRSRIAAGLAKKQQETSDPQLKNRLETQLILLSGASISTLHGFCQNLIRQYIHKIGWEPDFRLLNDTESSLLKEDILDQTLEEYYLKGNPDFLELADSHGGNADDRILRSLILNLHELSLSQPWPEDWLKKTADQFSTCTIEDFSETLWGQVLLSHANLILDECEQLLFGMNEEAARRERTYGETFSNDGETLRILRAALSQGWDNFSDALAQLKFQTAQWGVSAKNSSEEEQEDKAFFESLRALIKSRTDSLKKLFPRSSKELLGDLRAVAPELTLLSQITIAFAGKYQEAKIADGLADFSDLEHGALSLLRSDDASPENPNQPSEVALELCEKYKEILVDEYQDTNSVQESIISLLCDHGDAYRFQVGDVKQSIYKFRLAEPALFLRKYHSYPNSDDAQRILLNQNFRSRKEILQGINFICAQLFQKDTAELDYGSDESLNSGADFPDWNDQTLAGPIELHLLEKETEELEAEEDNSSDPLLDEDGEFRREAHLAAQLIREWYDKEKLVYDKKKKEYRPFQWRDAVILLRSVKGRTPDLLEVLRSYEIPCHADVDEGYFTETEVQVLLSTLATIDNPYQDIHLASTLRSPMAHFTEPELAQIRLCQPQGAFWESLQIACTAEHLPESLRHRLEKFLSQYRSWREFSRRESVPALIRKVLSDTLYDSWVTALPGGTLRAANLRTLQERAQEFENSGMRGLFRFLRFIDKLREKGADWGPARVLGEGENLVRILSIHKSKGLEFPAVILLNLGKKFNTQDLHGPILFHKTLGAGPYRTDLNLRYRYPTAPRHAIQIQTDRENKAEELRVLYVALTRAEEKLVLIGSGKNLPKKIAFASLQAIYSMADSADDDMNYRLPAGFVLSGKSYLDWLLLAVARHKDMLPLLSKVNAPFTGEVLDDDTPWKIEIHEQLLDPNDHSRKEFPEKQYLQNRLPLPTTGQTDISSLLNWHYDHQDAVGKPGKTSVTELKRRLDWFEREDTIPELNHTKTIRTETDRPRFIQELSGLTPAEKGTQLHSLMQHLDFSRADNLENLKSQIASLVEKGLLPDKGTDDLPLAAIVTLVNSPLGQRLSAGIMHRELPFSALVPAEKLLPQWQGLKEPILIQGVVDLLLEEPDGYVLLDYKSDRLGNDEDFRQRYQHQLDLYREALGPILQKPIKEIWLYSFHHSRGIQLD